MLLYTRLARFSVRDSHGRHARLSDVAVGLLENDYPWVTSIRFREGGVERTLPWDAIESTDWQAGVFNVPDLHAGEPVSDNDTPPAGPGDVLLHRDILDALILDLPNRRATRANDLALEVHEVSGRLSLVAADTSVRAMLRRVTRGRFGRGLAQSKLYDWKYIEFLRGDPSAVKAGAIYHRRIERLPPGEIARLVEALPYLHAAELITLLADKLAADVLEAMSPSRQLQVFEELSDEQQLTLLGLMAPDLGADLVGRLHTEVARRVLAGLKPGPSQRIVELLRFPENSVGGIMTNDFVCIPRRLSVAEAREALRDRLREPDFIFFVYVVEDEKSQRLRGVITLRDIITAKAEARVEDIMNPYLVTLHRQENARDAAYRVLNSNLAALPVTDREGHLRGIVTIDQAVAQVAPASWSAQAPRVFS